MGKANFYKLLEKELRRIDESKTAKRHEKIIEGFSSQYPQRAIISGSEYMVFNSNDYLGLKHNPVLKKAEEQASKKYGSGPGAVRFISGSLKIYDELEKELAFFHEREACMLFSSAFAANLSVIHCLIKGQSKDSQVSGNTLVISDELNHRSIIDGIRVAGLDKANKAIFKHMNLEDLRAVLKENKEKFNRVVVVTDGIFSMLGECQDISRMQEVCDDYDAFFEQGIITIVDDSHGVAAFGKTGRGAEEHTKGKADVVVGTLGKGFGADGGYVVSDKIIIDYLRESAATYIYSNPISPGTAGAGLAAVRIVNDQGKALLKKLNENINYFKEMMKEAGFRFAADSIHPIQPVLIADPVKTKALADELFRMGIMVTNINYPVVPRGKDEIRVQLSAAHTKEDIHLFVEKCVAAGKLVGIF